MITEESFVVTREQVCDYNGRAAIACEGFVIASERFVIAREMCVILMERFVIPREKFVNTTQGV